MLGLSGLKLAKFIADTLLNCLSCFYVGAFVSAIGLAAAYVSEDGLAKGISYGVIVFLVTSGVMGAVQASDLSARRGGGFSIESIGYALIAAIWGGAWVSMTGFVRYFLHGQFGGTDSIIMAACFSIACFLISIIPRKKRGI